MGININEFILGAFKRAKKPRIMFLSLIAFALLGSIYIRIAWIAASDEAAEHALTLARTAKASLQDRSISKLQASIQDIDKPQYEHIKNALIELVKVDNNIRIAYVYTLRDGKLYFMVDSEQLDSQNYSPPGQEYTEANQAYMLPFITGEWLVTGLVSDRWGRWISVLVPVKDSESGKIIAVFGMDYDAKTWKHAIFIHVMQAGMVILALFLLLMVYYRLLYKNEALREEKRKLGLANEELKYLSFHDSLTGLYNRAFFEEELKRLDTERNLPLSIIMGDLNGLKLINDTFGHQTGDELLKICSLILKNASRKEDIIARIGGDEFIVLLPRTPEKHARNLATRIMKECGAVELQGIKVSISLGVACKEDLETDINKVMILSDERMYDNKLNGK